jgi:hypothetical protein
VCDNIFDVLAHDIDGAIDVQHDLTRRVSAAGDRDR